MASSISPERTTCTTGPLVGVAVGAAVLFLERGVAVGEEGRAGVAVALAKNVALTEGVATGTVKVGSSGVAAAGEN